jgi:hypothetical protein
LVAFIGPEFDGEITISIDYDQIFTSLTETFSSKIRVFFDSTGVKSIVVDGAREEEEEDDDMVVLIHQERMMMEDLQTQVLVVVS